MTNYAKIITLATPKQSKRPEVQTKRVCRRLLKMLEGPAMTNVISNLNRLLKMSVRTNHLVLRFLYGGEVLRGLTVVF